MSAALRATTLTFLLLMGAGPARAQSPLPALRAVSGLAVLSLVGDQMSVDIYRDRTGTNLDTNRTTAYPFDDPVFDHMALLAASEAVRRELPAAKVVTLGVPKAGSTFDPNRIVAEKDALATHPVIEALRGQGYTHLLAISKLRAPARMDFVGQTIGSGQVQGLGFYVDPFLAMVRRQDTGETSVGFIAPYAYLRLSLVETASGRVLSERPITANVVTTMAGTPAMTLWEAMTPSQKVQALRALIDRSIRSAVPGMLRAP